VTGAARALAFVAVLFVAGCSCGERTVEAPSPPPGTPPEPTPATGWSVLAVVPEHGVPAAAAFERGGDALWLVTPEGKRLRRVGLDGAVGEPISLETDEVAGSILAERRVDEVVVKGLVPRTSTLLTVLMLDGGAVEVLSKIVASARPLGSLDWSSDGSVTVLDAAQRPITEGVHPAVRGSAIPGGRRVRAGITNAGPTLFVTGDDGVPRRVLLGSIPKAEKVRVLGVDGTGKPWLMAETGAADARKEHLVRVDLEGRVLERGVPPEIDDTKGPAGPGKGSGRSVVAVHADGRLAWLAPGETGIEVHVYTPGVPGRGLPQVQVRPPEAP